MAARNAELEHQSCSKQERTFMAIRFGNAVSCAKSLMGVVLLILLYAGFGHSQAFRIARWRTDCACKNSSDAATPWERNVRPAIEIAGGDAAHDSVRRRVD